jgi:hypothetical protein
MYEGKEHLVAPCVAVREGVLEYPERGTREFLPFNSIRESAVHWEGMPFTVTHPRYQGQNLNARRKDVQEATRIGWFFNAKAEGKKLNGEIWLEKEKANSHPLGKRILSKMQDGEEVPVSTAYKPELEENPGVHNGKEYDLVQRDLKPNHIAGLIFEEPRSEGTAAPRLNSEGRIVDSEGMRVNQDDVIVHQPEWESLSDFDTEWNAPDLEDFTGDDWGDISDEEKKEIASHFLVSMSGTVPENFTDLKFPVVTADGELNLSALRNAKGRVPQADGMSADERERANTIVTNLANENWDQTDFTENSMESELSVFQKMMNMAGLTDYEIVEQSEGEENEEDRQNSKHNTAEWLNRLIIKNMNENRTRAQIIDLLAMESNRETEWWRRLLNGEMMEPVDPEDLEAVKIVLDDSIDGEITQSDIIRHLEMDGQSFSSNSQSESESDSDPEEQMGKDNEDQRDNATATEEAEADTVEESVDTEEESTDASGDGSAENTDLEDRVESLENTIADMNDKLGTVADFAEEVESRKNSRKKEVVESIQANSKGKLAYSEDELMEKDFDDLQKLHASLTDDNFAGNSVASDRRENSGSDDEVVKPDPVIGKKDES